ncbi:MAG: hypothetical protein NVS1B1_10640 [Candidatus Limnocylindrales bacterium]
MNDLSAEKQAAIDELELAYQEELARLDALAPADLDRPVWTGEGDGWRIRDLFAHYARWQRISALAARRIASGVEPPPEPEFLLRPFVGIDLSLDDLNGECHGAWRERPVVECRAELEAAHRELIAALADLPPHRVVKDDGKLYRYFWQPGINHLRQHREHIDIALKEAKRS